MCHPAGDNGKTGHGRRSMGQAPSLATAAPPCVGPGRDPSPPAPPSRFGGDLARIVVTQAAGDSLRSKRSPLSVLPDWLAQHVSLGLEDDAAQGTVQLPTPPGHDNAAREDGKEEEDTPAK